MEQNLIKQYSPHTKVISLIIPCYNVEKYIDRCLNSVVNQTIGLENLEVILVNDASTDDTLSKLYNWQNQYPNDISVITYTENIRQGGARNKGILASTCPYIGFIDSDDWVEPEMYEEMYNAILKYNVDVVKVKCLRDSNSDGCINDSLPGECIITNAKTTNGVYLMEDENTGRNGLNGGVWSCLYKKKLIETANVLFPEKTRYEDNYFGRILSLYISSNCVIDKILYHYYVNSESTIMSPDSSSIIERLNIETMVVDEMKRRNLYEPFYEKLLKDYIRMAIINTWHILFTRFAEYPITFDDSLRELKKNFPDYESSTVSIPNDRSALYLFNAILRRGDNDISRVALRYNSILLEDTIILSKDLKQSMAYLLKMLNSNEEPSNIYYFLELALGHCGKLSDDQKLTLRSVLVSIIKYYTLDDDLFIYLISVLAKEIGADAYFDLLFEAVNEYDLSHMIFYYDQLQLYMSQNGIEKYNEKMQALQDKIHKLQADDLSPITYMFHNIIK